MRDNEMDFLANIHFQNNFKFLVSIFRAECYSTAHAQIIIFIARYLRFRTVVA